MGFFRVVPETLADRISRGVGILESLPDMALWIAVRTSAMDKPSAKGDLTCPLSCDWMIFKNLFNFLSFWRSNLHENRRRRLHWLWRRIQSTPKSHSTWPTSWRQNFWYEREFWFSSANNLLKKYVRFYVQPKEVWGSLDGNSVGKIHLS